MALNLFPKNIDIQNRFFNNFPIKLRLSNQFSKNHRKVLFINQIVPEFVKKSGSVIRKYINLNDLYYIKVTFI